MFGLFRKGIPAPQRERENLVKRLFLARCECDPDVAMMASSMGINPQDISGQTLIQGAPEATILRIIEQFLMMQDRGATEEFAVKTLNQMHSAVLEIAGEDLTVLQRASTLFQYVRHAIDVLHSNEGWCQISDHMIIDAIQDIKSYYKR